MKIFFWCNGFKEDSFFRKSYRIPSVGFSPYGWERGLVFYCLLENWNSFSTSVPAFVCVDYIETNPTTHSVVIDITTRYRSVLSHFSLILSRVCLWGQPHVSAFYTLCLMWCPTFGDFSPFMPCSPLWNPISISNTQKMDLSTEGLWESVRSKSCRFSAADFDFHFP